MNPYSRLKEKSYWKPSIANKNFYDIDELWVPKFRIDRKSKFATYGSCFAQHISKSIQENGFKWLDCERVPKEIINKIKIKYNYGVYSSRVGNIYTIPLLLQWAKWSLGYAEPPEEFWFEDGVYFDPFRPNIEPNGFSSLEELKHSRLVTLSAFKKSIENCSIFIFTMGLTESWEHVDGHIYPLCPGTVRGVFDDKKHIFKNYNYLENRSAIIEFIKICRQINKKIKFIFTVSPVPLVATMSDSHILPATVYSKSVLRALAGELTKYSYVDYFPSYEIINSHPYRSAFYEPNLRSVNPRGVEHVMRSFLCFVSDNSIMTSSENKDNDLICEEELLDAFLGDKK